MVLERALDVCRYRLDKEQLQLRTRVEPDLPLVRMDENAITLVILNLVDNAIKYGADGGAVEVTLERVPGGVVLSVRDFGPGHPARGAGAHLRAVLPGPERPRPQRARQRHRPGAGPAHRRGARRAGDGGEPGAGARRPRGRFCIPGVSAGARGRTAILTPVRAAAVSWSPRPPRRPRPPNHDHPPQLIRCPAGRRRPQKILIIEDEPDIARGLRDALEFEGFEVLDRRHRRARASPRSVRAHARSGDPGPDAARPERLPGVRADPRQPPDAADHHADRPLAGGRQDPRAGGGRRRLRHQAVLGRRAGGAHRGDLPPHAAHRRRPRTRPSRSATPSSTRAGTSW